MCEIPTLSPRELQVVRLVVDGLSNPQIADRLRISSRTAQAHVAKAMRRTGTCSRTQLAVLALRTGLVPFQPVHEGCAGKACKTASADSM
ncbi:MAG: response regulator transcription factor [Solirubrobacteraceae bacterium]|jgi:DNA-binding NarL/FixJ family response regulator